ncbi:MAG: hypothetical protein U9Q61_01200 [Thermodesulfobacteriota bacterium]|nr:hypothetical protein [Thermodesulfobacteriota bacterium]
MKTTLTLLIAGLIFLATPMLASADRGDHHDRQKYDRGWFQGDRHTYNQHYSQSYNRHDQRRDHYYKQRNDHKQNPRVKTHLKRKLRETRQDLRQIKRQIRHNHRRPYYAKRHYSNPAVVIGIPHLVFQFDW